MILSTHIVIAGAIARPLLHIHPALTFGIALATHYLADAIPHWDYKINSTKGKEELNKHERHTTFSDKGFRRDIVITAIDTAVGTAVIALVLPHSTPLDLLTIALIAGGAVLPDFLQAVYLLWKHPILTRIQNFHNTFHTKIKLGAYPLIGIPSQIIIFLAATILLL